MGNEDYKDPGASGPPPIGGWPTPTPSAATEAANEAKVRAQPDPPEEGRITEDYERENNDDLEGEIVRRGLTVPAEGSGSGQGGKVVKRDLVAVLEEDDSDDGPDADSR